MFLSVVLLHFATTSVEFKLVATQVVGSVVILAAKLKLLQKLESTLRNMLHQLTTLHFAARQVGHKSGNMRNSLRVFQIAMQQCCEAN